MLSSRGTFALHGLIRSSRRNAALPLHSSTPFLRLFASINGNGPMDSNNEPSLLSETIKSLTAQGLPEVDKSKSLPKPPIMTRIKEGLSHYWHGSKLLAYETKISTKLLIKLMRGEQLIRRERRQLLRTTSDLFRLVPFIVIAIIPFLEFALPVLLKLFPNMLPSTFEDKDAANDKIRKQIKVKLEMAKFLQDAVEQMSATGLASPAAKEFAELYKKARITGEALSMPELERVCHSLKDSLTIDNLDRAQLVSLCKYMDVKAFGTDAYLRYQVRKALNNIYRDDQEILQEGVDSLFVQELEHACRIRGLFYPGINETSMRRELKLWLDLHINKGIPSVLLILSRALAPNMSLLRPEEALKDTILSLPDAVVNEAELHQRELAGSEAVSFKKKLEVLEQQQDLIAEELAQEKASKTVEQKEELSKGELKEISEAISILSSSDPVEREKQELSELKADIDEFKSDAETLESITQKKLKEPKAAEIIGEKLEKLVDEIEAELLSLQDKVGDRLKLISMDKDGSVTIDQLEKIFKLIRKDPGESERLRNIIQTFDTDGDGKILVSDILKMAESAEEKEGHGTVIDNKQPSNSK